MFKATLIELSILEKSSTFSRIPQEFFFFKFNFQEFNLSFKIRKNSIPR